MKKIVAALSLMLVAILATPAQAQSVPLLVAATTTAAGESMQSRCLLRTYQATGTTSAGAGAATIIVEGSNLVAPAVATTAVDWVTLGTVTLTLGTTKTGGGFSSHAIWRWVRARVSAISGTNASVDAYMGC